MPDSQTVNHDLNQDMRYPNQTMRRDSIQLRRQCLLHAHFEVKAWRGTGFRVQVRDQGSSELAEGLLVCTGPSLLSLRTITTTTNTTNTTNTTSNQYRYCRYCKYHKYAATSTTSAAKNTATTTTVSTAATGKVTIAAEMSGWQACS